MRPRTVQLLSALLLAVTLVLPARTWAQQINLIRDAEIETTIRSYATPLFQVAGLNPQGIKLFLVNDDSLNAFVAGGLNMFLNTGLLMRADDPLQVIGVIAHETGHLSGAHIARRGDAQEASQTGALVSYVLGLGAILASGRPEIGAAIISGGQDIALKGLLRYSRAQESSADQAALNFLQATEQSPEGLLHFMEILSDQEVLLSSSQDPYLRTHPLSEDRIEFYRQAVEQSPYRGQAARPDFIQMHKRMQAKLIGFLQPLSKVLKKYPESDSSLEARYARSIAYYKVPELDRAITLIDGLLAEHPQDAFFHELKGQVLFENGKVAAALPEYEAAVKLQPNSATILRSLAQVQIELNAPDLDQEALETLAQAVRLEPGDPFSWRLAAVAHGRQGNEAMTALSLAEAAFLSGRYVEARDRADRAQALLPQGSPAGLRAADLQNEAERRAQKQKKNN